MSNWYYLKHRKPVPFGCTVLTDPEKFFTLTGKHFDKHGRRVRQRTVGPYWVSTVFLGLDHQIMGSLPILFETMIFKNGNEVWSHRCSTHRQALNLHQEALRWANEKN